MAVPPMASLIKRRRTSGLGNARWIGEAGCSSIVANVKAEIIKTPRQAPSIKYSGQWFLKTDIAMACPNRSIECNYILDAAAPAKQEIAVCFHGKASGDERLHGIGPAIEKGPDIADGSFESVASRIHGPEHDLIFQHQVAHHQVGVDFHRPLPSRYSGEHKDTIGAEMLDHIESQTRSAGGFIDKIDVADLSGERFERMGFRRKIMC